MLLMKIILFALNVKFSRLRQGTKFRRNKSNIDGIYVIKMLPDQVCTITLIKHLVFLILFHFFLFAFHICCSKEIDKHEQI